MTQHGASGEAIGAPAILVVTDGRAGNEAQALGLAEAMARLRPFSIAVRRLAPGEEFATPGRPPAIFIGCGRRAAGLTRRSDAGFRIQILDPRDDPARYDLVIAPFHDGLDAPNAVGMLGAPNRIDRAAIAMINDPRLAALGRPLVGVMVGGPNRAFRFTTRDALALAERLAGVAGALAISASRRTPPAAVAALRARFPAALFHDPATDDPANNFYPALLRHADAMIVTEDSVNMASEAATCGAPLYIAAMPRRAFASARKFKAFHAALAESGRARAFEGAAPAFATSPLDETERVARIAVERWLGRGDAAHKRVSATSRA